MRQTKDSHEEMFKDNTLTKFIFDNTNIKGQVVTLCSYHRDVISINSYSQNVSKLLGEFIAAVCLLNANFKYNGRLILHAQRSKGLSSIMAECTSKNNIRGIVRGDFSMLSDQIDFYQMFKKGTLRLTMEPESGDRYQGIVPICENTLSGCLEYYFEQSEQLKTKIKLAGNMQTAAGILLQEMPEQTSSDDCSQDWREKSILLETLRAEEQINLAHYDQLTSLFSNDDVRILSVENPNFWCSCSRERFLKALHELYLKEPQSFFEEGDSISVNCEFCDKNCEFHKSEFKHTYNQQWENNLSDI